MREQEKVEEVSSRSVTFEGLQRKHRVATEDGVACPSPQCPCAYVWHDTACNKEA